MHSKTIALVFLSARYPNVIIGTIRAELADVPTKKELIVKLKPHGSVVSVILPLLLFTSLAFNGLAYSVEAEGKGGSSEGALKAAPTEPPKQVLEPVTVSIEIGECLYQHNCAACHVNGSENLPLADTDLNVVDPSGWIKNAGPASAVCSGCHVSKTAASHFLLNTSVLGEACGVCHGVKGDFSVAKVHAK